MDNFLNTFTGADYASQPLNLMALLLGLGLSFLAGQAISWTYMATHAGLSYSRAFVNALVVIPMIVTVVMMVLNNNLVTAFGLMAVFAVVRFRNVLRDTLDTSYVLTVLAVGMGCGTQRFSVAVIAAVALICVMFYLWYISYGVRHRYDVIVNFHWTRPQIDMAWFIRVLKRHARDLHCATQRSTGATSGTDFSYRLLLRDPERTDELISELGAVEGVSSVNVFRAQEESEL